MLGKRILYLSTVILLLGSCALEKDVTEERSTPPNILLLFTDDQTYDALGALSEGEVHTPHLDQLVARGTTFTHAYNMGGWHGAVCMASRAMMITGLPVWPAQEVGDLLTNKDSTMIVNTWGKLMEAAGYDTYMSGKWHVNAPPESVFQTVAHPRPGMPPDAFDFRVQPDKIRAWKAGEGEWNDIMPVGYNRPLGPDDNSWSAADTSFGGFWSGGQHWSEVLADDAVGFLATAAEQPNPFFMYLAFNAPHDPRQAPQEYLDLYDPSEVTLPINFAPFHPDRAAMGCDESMRDECLAPFPRTEYAVKQNMLEYYALISHLDEQIGRILSALETSGKADNTYIFFTADHGLGLGRHGLMGKQNLYDHSIRVPLLVTGPDIPAGQRIGADVYLQDVMASSLEIAGAEKPEDLFFHSLLGLARGEQTESNYPAIYGCFQRTQRMIRKDGYKLIILPATGKQYLFDMETDPYEINNLAEDPTQRERLTDLLRELVDLQTTVGDTLTINS